MKRDPLDSAIELPAAFIPGKIGVVTVLFNSASVLPDFFESIDSQTHRNLVVYCVDNASKDGSADMCEAHGAPYITFRNEKNVGVAAGNNQGIKAAVADGCEYILLLNNDVLFGGTLFAEMIEGLSRNHCDMTTPVMNFFEPSNLIWCAGGTFKRWKGNTEKHLHEFEQDDGHIKADKQVAYSPTCCVLFKRELFATVGIMDERYFVYWDDTDWMLRANRMGAKMFLLAGSRLWHKVSSLTGGGDSDFMIRYTRRNHAYYLYKHLGRFRASLYSCIYLAYYRVRLLTISSRHKSRLSIESWKEGTALYFSARGSASAKRG